MKTFKKVLASTLAAAMVVTALPVTPANAAAAPKLSATKATLYTGQSKTIKVTTPKTWKSVKVKATTSKKSVATVKASKKKVTVKAVKAGTAKVTVKVTGKKGKKAVKKTLKATITVKNPALSVSAAGEVAVGSTEAIKATVKPANTKVTYTTSDEKIATVDAKGVVTGIAAGDVAITVKAGKTTKTVNMTVKKAILKSVEQTEHAKVEAVIVGDTKGIKAGDIKITNTATKATVAVKSVAAKKGAENTFVIETFTDMVDAKDYSVEYAGSVATFTATDNTVAKVALTKTEVPAGIKTEVKAVTKDAKGVILGDFALTNTNNAKGQVTTALTITKGYVQGSDVFLPTIGDTMVAKITYHTGTYGTDGTETGKIEDTVTITAVDPTAVTYNYAVTIGDRGPSWTATSFKANTAIKIGAQKNAYFRITDDNGNDLGSYTGYSVETADPTKLVVEKKNLTNNQTAVVVNGVSAGDTYILVKKDGKVVFSLPVQVQGKATATTIDLNKTSVTVVSNAAVNESVVATLKDQYGDNLGIKSGEAKVELLAKPDGAANVNLTATINGAKATVNVKGTDFRAAGKYGTYTYKITLKDDAGKAITRSFTVNYVDTAATQSYQLSLPTEVDTTVTKDTTAANVINISVLEMANGGAKNTYSEAVKYTVKDSAGNTVDSKYITDNTNSIAVTAVSKSGSQYTKNLKTGTYYVTAEFTVGTNKVAVSGSFTIKDSQDTNASIKVKNNDLGNTKSVSAAMVDSNYVEFTYDGLLQNNVVVSKVNSTPAGNTEYVTSVEVFVTITGSANTVLVTVPVNQSFVNVK